MTTPQQIKNEVEKEGLEILERLEDDIKEGRSFLVDEKDYPSYLNVVDNEVNLAKSKILTEYDKSIKEMIEEVAGKYCKSWNDTEQLNKDLWVITESDEFTQEQKNEVLGEVAHIIGGHLIPDILSKIGDNSEVKE